MTLVSGICCLVAAQARPLPPLELPPGFSVSWFAEDVPDARSLAVSPGGTVFVGTRRAGAVYALPDKNRDGRADRVVVLARGLNMPNGVAFRDGHLYVAEVGRILRFDQIETRLDRPPRPRVWFSGLPSDAHHGWKFIRFGPDGWLYVPVGAPCDICAPDPARYAALFRIRPDGKRIERVARGIRNSVGFDWHPVSADLWFTDNGRDGMGDDLPADELNRVRHRDEHFGYPYCHGRGVRDPEFGHLGQCADSTAPSVEFPAHVAPLGLRFLDLPGWPAPYRHSALVAFHGSWNRSQPAGYLIAQVSPSNNTWTWRPFASGWLRDNTVLGRPVDLEATPDGALLVSDDHSGGILRITYQPAR